MGNKTFINGKQVTADNFEKTFVKKGVQTDARFGKGEIYHQKDDKSYQILVCNLAASGNKKQVQQMEQNLQRKRQVQNDSIAKNNNYLAEIFGHQTVNQKGMCGDQNKVRLAIEYFAKTLKTDLQQRKTRNNGYGDEQVYDMIKRGSGAILNLNEQQSYHGDIRSEKVSLTNNGQAIWYDNMLLTKTNCLQAKLNKDLKAVVPPEMFNEWNKKQTSFKGDWVKADIYQLGVVALEMYSLKDISTLVNTNKTQVIQEEVQKHLAGKRNHHLEGLIQRMLDVNPITRIDARTAFTEANQYAAVGYAQQQPVLEQRPSVQQQPVLEQRPSQIVQQPIVEQRPSVQQQPIVEQRPSQIVQQPIIEQRPSYIVQQPIVEQRPSYIVQQPIVEQRPSYIVQQPIVEQRPSYIVQQPIIEQRQTIQQYPTQIVQKHSNVSTQVIDRPTQSQSYSSVQPTIQNVSYSIPSSNQSISIQPSITNSVVNNTPSYQVSQPSYQIPSNGYQGQISQSRVVQPSTNYQSFQPSSQYQSQTPNNYSIPSSNQQVTRIVGQSQVHYN